MREAESAMSAEVIVVADNCSDDTAVIAKEAGAKVLVRIHSDLRAKGYALEHAFQRVLGNPEVDAIVVVDADSRIHPGSLAAFERAIRNGAEAVQGRYTVSNRFDGWRTLLMAVAMGAYNDVRSRGRERLGLSCGLLGNGMCFTAGLLRRLPFASHGLVEDAEYTIRLARAGIRVRHVTDAGVSSEVPVSAAAARSQRIRWESGRLDLRKNEAWPLLLEGLIQRNPILLELGLDLLTPPLASIALISAGGLACALWMSSRMGSDWQVMPMVSVASLLVLAVYVLRGWGLSGTGTRGLAALVMAPAYVAWKLMFTVGKSTGSWVRTRRNSATE